jgi:hypothetical protein
MRLRRKAKVTIQYSLIPPKRELIIEFLIIKRDTHYLK